MKCCGVLNADDWRTNVTNPDWSPATFNKPLGCCNWKKDDKVSDNWTFVGWMERLSKYHENIFQAMDTDISKISTEVETCRSALYTTDSEKVYHFEGCLSKFRSEITDNKEMVIWIAIAALLALVIQILQFYFDFRKCILSGCNTTCHYGHVYDYWGLKNISMWINLLQSWCISHQ